MAEWSGQDRLSEEEIPGGQAAEAMTDGERDPVSADMAEDGQPEAAPADAHSEEDEINAMIEQLCVSKAEEFRLIGYEHVNGQDVWECVSDKYHKKGTPPLYQVVNDILSLKVTQFMNYITLNMYRGDQRG